MSNRIGLPEPKIVVVQHIHAQAFLPHTSFFPRSSSKRAYERGSLSNRYDNQKEEEKTCYFNCYITRQHAINFRTKVPHKSGVHKPPFLHFPFDAIKMTLLQPFFFLHEKNHQVINHIGKK